MLFWRLSSQQSRNRGLQTQAPVWEEELGGICTPCDDEGDEGVCRLASRNGLDGGIADRQVRLHNDGGKISVMKTRTNFLRIFKLFNLNPFCLHTRYWETKIVNVLST